MPHPKFARAFKVGHVIVTAKAFDLLCRAGLSPAELLAEHAQWVPAKAVAVDLGQRMQAIHLRQRVLTRFPVRVRIPQPHIAETCVVTEAGHRETFVLLAQELSA